MMLSWKIIDLHMQILMKKAKLASHNRSRIMVA
jgi:hypothetical protein